MLPLALALSAAWAAESEQYTTLETSVVSASGFEQDVREAPASVSVITSKELQSKPVSDIGSAIGDVPGVDIGLSKMGNSTVSIRGFDAAYTLMLVDGKRQNVSTAMMNNGFDPTSSFMPPIGFIDRIEVLRGPASVAWGSDAVGGVVNIITKRHPKAFTGSITVEGTLQQHDDLYGNSGGTSFYVGVPLKEDTLSLILRGRYQKTGEQGIMTPAGQYATHTSAETYNGNLGGRLTLTVDEANSFYVDADYTRFKGGSMQTAQQGYQAHRWYDKYDFVAAHEGSYKWGTTETYFQYNALDLMKVDLRANALTTVNYPSWKPQTHEGSFSDPLMSSRTYTLSTKFIAPLEMAGGQALKLTGGLEGSYETFEDNYYETVIFGQKLNQTLLAGFLEGEYFLSEEWIATVGARVNWSDIFGSNLAPRAYLVYRPFDHLSFKGGVAAGYKTPNVKQLMNGVYSGTEPGGQTYGNPDLKPEESLSYELSTTLDFGSYAQLTLGGFYTDFKNMIGTENYDGGVCVEGRNGQISCDKHAVNYGKVRTQGLEVLFKTTRINGFSFTAGYTFTDAEVREGSKQGERPNELPRHTLTARLDYEQGPFSAYVKSASKFDMKVDKSGRGALARDKYEDYTIVDIGASYVFLKNHRISAAVNNLFDKSTNEWALSDTGGWANAYSHYLDGRNLWLSYTYSF